MDYGGQAVIEGVMMRGKTHMTIAARLPDKSLLVKRERLAVRTGIAHWFFLRGIYTLVDMLALGFQSLNWSAKQQLEEEEAPSGFVTTIFTVLSFLIALALFKFLPLGVATLVNPSSSWVFNLIDGGVKLAIFLIYIRAISFSSDIKRVFQYHGAEHKAIACYEAKKALTVKHALPFRKEHPRCGTNFLFIVIVISMFFYLLIPLSLPIWQNFIIRIAFLPFIAGVSYELLKGFAKSDTLLSRILIAPGMLIQKLTTFEPDKEQMEVGLIALKELLDLEKKA